MISALDQIDESENRKIENNEEELDGSKSELEDKVDILE